ncbi:MAG: hypothetical protein WAU33_16100 [Candidatus Binataceae bacterium]
MWKLQVESDADADDYADADGVTHTDRLTNRDGDSYDHPHGDPESWDQQRFFDDRHRSESGRSICTDLTAA